MVITNNSDNILAGYSLLALRIIEEAHEDLEFNNDVSAYEFLNSDWYNQLHELAGYYVNNGMDYINRFDMGDIYIGI